MRRWLLIGVSLIGFSTLVSAQEAQNPRAVGYFFFAPGAVFAGGGQARTFQFGGGGEGRIYKDLSAGAELGVLATERAGLLSLNGFYHFPTVTRSGKFVPFLTAGYTRAGGEEWRENWFNFGGGTDYWFKQKVALRLEIRDQVDTNHCELLHFVGGRMGIVWR